MLVQNCVDQQTTSPGRLPQIPFFRELTHTKYPPRVRGLAAIGLGFCQHPDARQVLLKLFERVAEEDAFVAWCVVEALAMYKDDAKVMKDHPPCLWRPPGRGREPAAGPAAWAGSRRRRLRATQLLVRALSNPDVETRSYAVFALARLDLLGARAAIEGQLNVEQEPRVLRAIAKALLRNGRSQFRGAAGAGSRRQRRSGTLGHPEGHPRDTRAARDASRRPDHRLTLLPYGR